MPPLSRVPIAPFLMLRNMEGWKRQVALVCLAQGVASIGWSFMQPFYPLFIEQELGVESGADAAFWAGASSGVFALFMGIAGPFWGHLADTYGRKPMLVRAYTAGTLVLMFSGLITNIPSSSVCESCTEASPAALVRQWPWPAPTSPATAFPW